MCQTASYAVIDRPVYEKVLCTIPLYLADDNGLRLDVYHELDISSVMTLYSRESKQVEMVEVRVESCEGPGWSLTFCPPHPGIAHLSVTVAGKHLRKYELSMRSNNNKYSPYSTGYRVTYHNGRCFSLLQIIGENQILSRMLSH